jgi:hypothetical protein
MMVTIAKTFFALINRKNAQLFDTAKNHIRRSGKSSASCNKVKRNWNEWFKQSYDLAVVNIAAKEMY